MIERACAIRFLLNDEVVTSPGPNGAVVLDHVRASGATGTKEGCREGDCGSCVVLVGELDTGGTVVYRARNSCLLPLGEVDGCHVVTVEGLEERGATDETSGAIQQAIVQEGASQCGFCTPGFVVSLAGHFLNSASLSRDDAIEAMEGNICRCTGYLALVRAAGRVADRVLADARVPGAAGSEERLRDLIRHGVLPAFFEHAAARLRGLEEGSAAGDSPAGDSPAGSSAAGSSPAGGSNGSPSPMDSVNPATMRVLGGGTDLFVQLPDEIADEPVRLVSKEAGLADIAVDGDTLTLGGAVRMEALKRSAEYRAIDADVDRHLRLIGSQPIRESATLAGNLVNASPIGDLTIMLLALGARLDLRAIGGAERCVALADFYRGYKDIDLEPGEIVARIRLPRRARRFSFEKVSRRTHLDIASVNTALAVDVEDDRVVAATVSAGGVAPVPLVLARTSAGLVGKKVDADVVRQIVALADDEVAPISDVRGSAAYKRLLLRQLIVAHFVRLFPAAGVEEAAR